MTNRKHTYLKSSVFRTSILYRFLLFFGCKIAIKKQSLRSKKTESKQSSFSNAFCGWLQTLTRGPESTQEIPKARHESGRRHRSFMEVAYKLTETQWEGHGWPVQGPRTYDGL